METSRVERFDLIHASLPDDNSVFLITDTISTFASLENEIHCLYICNLCYGAELELIQQYILLFVCRRKWNSVGEFSQMKQNTLLEVFPLFFGNPPWTFFENSTNISIRPLLFPAVRWSSVFYSCCYWHLRINIATPNGRSRPFPFCSFSLLCPPRNAILSVFL